MLCCKGFLEVWSSAGWLRVWKEFLRDRRKVFDEKCMQGTWELVVFIVSHVVGAALQRLFGGLQQCRSAQSVRGVSQRIEDGL